MQCSSACMYTILKINIQNFLSTFGLTCSDLGKSSAEQLRLASACLFWPFAHCQTDIYNFLPICYNQLFSVQALRKWRFKMAVSLSEGNALDRDLDEIFSQFPSRLLEIERHLLTANVVMCDLFIWMRTEDCARFVVASVAQAGISDTLMHNVQELLTVLENN